MSRASALVFTAIAFAIAAAPVDAAVTRGLVFACRDPAILVEGAKLRAKGDAKASETFESAKIASGECTPIMRNSVVGIDERRGPLLCIRPTGGLDCYWTVKAGVDEFANGPQKPDSAAPAGRSRR